MYTCPPIVYIHKTQCILPGLVNSVYMSHCGDDDTGKMHMDLNNRPTGKDATKTRALGLLGHSEHCVLYLKNHNLSKDFLEKFNKCALFQ